MDDNSKTIAQILKEIDDKTADRSEVLPLLKSIERNTSKATASAMCVAVEKAMVKATARSEKRQRTSTAGKRQQQASTAIVTSSKKNSSSPGKERSGPLLVQTRDSKSGRFVANAPGASRNIAAEQKQDTQNDKLSSILKDAVMQKKDTIKDTAGKLAFGPFWDIGKELKEAADAMKDNAKDEKSTVGRLKNWGKGTRLGKAAGNAKDRVVAKYQDRKAAKAAKTVAPAAANTTVVNNNGGGGGIVSEIAGNWLGNKMGGSKMGGKLLSKVPMLGKLFPSLAGGAAAAAAAGTVATEAGGAVAGGAAKAAGGGMLKAVGGRLPLIGGLISGGITLAQGGSASEAVGSGVGAVGGAALGTMVAGPIGTVVGGIAGEWIGKKLGGLFGKQNSEQEKLLGQEAQQQAGFFSQIPSVLGNAWNAAKNAVQDKVQGAKDAYRVTRERGGSFAESVGAGIKGAVRATRGKARDREQQLQEAAVASGMTDPKELAMFMAQAKHETAGFNTMEEYASGAKYEGRKDLGNTQPGDGKRFKGRGYFQLTGRANYEDMSKKLGVDLVNNPELAEDPAIASKIALQYWKDKKLSAPAKAGDLKTVTKRINGGLNGYDDRLAALQGYNTQFENGAPGATGKAADPQVATNQKASGTGTASAQLDTTPHTSKPVVAKSKGKSSRSGKKKTPGQPATAQAVSVEPAKQEDAAATSEGQAQKAAAPAPPPAVTTGTSVKAGTAPVVAGKTDYAAKTQAMLDKENQPEGTGGATAAPSVATTTGTVVKKEEPAQPGQPATAQAIPAVQPVDPSVATGTATMPQKQYGAGDILNERKSIDEASKQKKAKLLSDFRSGKTTEADYVKAAAEEDQSRRDKKASLDALSKKAESGQFVSQEEMDKATGKTPKTDTVQALSATQPPLPEVQRLQPPPPPPMEVPAIDKLAKAQEQQAQAQQQNISKSQDGSGGKPGIPNIKTDFDDTMLVLMSYDRT